MVEHEHDLFRFESLSYVLSFHVDVLKGFCTFNAYLPRGFVKPHVENMWPKTGDILTQLFLRLLNAGRRLHIIFLVYLTGKFT